MQRFLNTFLADVVAFTRYLAPHKKFLILILVLMLLESLVALASPWIAGYFTESLIDGAQQNRIDINQILLLWLLVLLLQSCLRFSNQFLLGRTSTRLVARLNQDLFDHIQSLPLFYFDDRKRGQILSLLTHDIHILGDYLTGTILSIFPQLLSFGFALILIAVINPVVAVLALIGVPLFFLGMKLIGRRIRPLSVKIAEAQAGLVALAEENLQLLPVIKSFTREPLESAQYLDANQRLVQLSERFLLIQSLMSPAIQFLGAGAIILILWLISAEVALGQLPVGDLVRLVLYGLMLVAPMSNLAGVYGYTQHARASAARINRVFAESHEPPGNPVQFPAIRGAIEFIQVDFTYPGRQPVLKDFSLSIRAGEIVAITGENGSGKSTLVYLLQRFAMPAAGEIRIDGVDITHYPLRHLRQQIGVVQQNVLLLNGSVRENIAFGKPDATEQEIVTAAINACALEFIQDLPDKMDTIIGDQGIKLSGGQKQRLSLARCLLKNPPIIILDEATAMFDPEGEQAFINASRKILGHCTVIIITHRPATLGLADRVVKLEQGRIVI